MDYSIKQLERIMRRIVREEFRSIEADLLTKKMVEDLRVRIDEVIKKFDSLSS